jgi:hypothetical protein
MSGRTKIAGDDRRCDAIAKTSDGAWQRNPHRCANAGTTFRAGRWVCGAHHEAQSVTYICGNRFDMLADALAPEQP